jgi:phosphoheptose isomerase
MTGKTWSSLNPQTQKPKSIYYPKTINEVVAVVINAEDQKQKVRAVGRGFSSSNITAISDHLVDLYYFKRCPSAGEQFLSPEDKEVLKDGQNLETLFQVEAGATLEELN